MVNISIIDDEKEMQYLLTEYINKFSKENEVEFMIRYYDDGLAFLEDRQSSDIVLMDIEMPHINGMKVAEKMREVDSEVALIFITNSTRYAIKGYSVDAIDYILKPVQYQRFSSVIKKTLRIIGQNLGAEVFIKTTNGVRKIYMASIYYVKVSGHLLKYYTKQGVIETWGALKDVEKQLSDANFIRCNHNSIVNLKYVLQFDKDTIVMEGIEDKLSISETKKKEFIKRFNQYKVN